MRPFDFQRRRDQECVPGCNDIEENHSSGSNKRAGACTVAAIALVKATANGSLQQSDVASQKSSGIADPTSTTNLRTTTAVC